MAIMLGSLVLFQKDASCEPASASDAIVRSMDQLRSTDRTARKAALAHLQEWAAQEPVAAKKILLSQLTQSPEPEIRERCLQLLRPIAAREFGNFGEGYIGISMGDVSMIQVPGEAQPRYGLVITTIQKESPAQQAALQQGDVIIALNHHRWKDPQSITDLQQGLSAKIRAVGAGNRANLEFWRKDKLMQVDMLLTRRPGNIDQLQWQLMPNGGIRINEEEMKRLVEIEKNSDEYFKEWLARQLTLKTNK